MTGAPEGQPQPRPPRLRRLRALLPRVEQPLWEVLREDRLLRWAVVVLWAASLVPLFVTPFLPFADLHINTAAASLLWDTAVGHQPTATYYKVNWAPIPYWTTYLITAFVERFSNPLVAAKVTTAAILLLVPLGMMRLLVTLRRSPRLALWAFLLGYEHNMYAGWQSFLFGVGLALFAIAWTLEARTLKEGLRVAPFSALVALTHIQAVALMLLPLPPLALFFRRPGRRLLIHVVAGAGTAIIVLPWLFARLGDHSAGPAEAFGFEWHTPGYKLAEVFAYTLDNFQRREGQRLAAIAFVLLVLGPLFLSLLPRKAAGERTAMPLILLAAAGALYALLPMSIFGPIFHWYTYPRYATVALLFLLLVPTPRLDGRWAAALLPGVLLCLALDVKITQQFSAYGERTQPLLEVIGHVRPGASMLPLVFDDDELDPDLKLPPYHQLHTYVAAFRKGYDGYLWNLPSVPLLYRAEMRKPAPYWDVAAQKAFTMASYGQHFDYILVQGFEKADPVAPLTAGPLPHPVLRTQAGRWRLYEIVR
jgi:hypothetical protein